MKYDYCVIGGGIVGLATAMQLLKKRPGASLVLIDKEKKVAQHQTGHNSGVIHAGIYYAPGSMKAELCVKGLEATEAFCTENNINFDRCGKLIVATDDVELERIGTLYDRAKSNGADIEKVGADELKAMEPNITGIGALLSPRTGIVDYREVAAAMVRQIEKAGGEIVLGSAVDRIDEGAEQVEIGAGGQSWIAGRLIVCGGLQADRLARLAGAPVDFRIVPFRGEYFQLPPEKNNIVNHLIYPAPNPDMPFLGIHLTKMIDGGVTVGPNAVLGMAREGYPKLSIDLRDLANTASYAGFWKMVWRERSYAAGELFNSLWKPGYLAACQKYCPELEIGDLQPYRAGIRAQAVTPDGKAIHDFLFAETPRSLHVCNAPSPAATSSIPIGDMIVDKVIAADAA